MMFDGAAVATAAAVLAPAEGDIGDHQVAHDASADPHQDAWRDTVDAGQAQGWREARADDQEATDGGDGAAAPAAPAATNIIFIDTSIADYGALVDEWSGKGEIVLIDASRDGIDQMMSALAGRSGIESIHIVSHGDVDRFRLGTTNLDAAAVNGDLAQSLASIGSKLTADGDILIYGCDVSADDTEQRFLSAIAARTGADVAASSDPTGAAAQGGDWDLEARVGEVSAFMLTSDRLNDLLQLTNNSAAWTIAGNTATNVTDGVTSTITFGGTTTGGGAVFTGTATQTLNAIDAFANSAGGTPSVSTVFNGGAAIGATGTITITFSEPVTNPIINIDRLGGAANGAANTSIWTLNTAGASLTRLNGPSHFVVDTTTGTIQRQLGGSSAGSESSLDTTQGTAAGSVRVNGTFTTITFTVQMSALASLGSGDGFEISTTVDAAPDARNDVFTANRGQTLAGNLFANNGSGADADIRGDAFTVTRVNGATFTVGSPITLSNGTLTITNAATGAFTFVPNGAYPSGQTFTYTIADANGGTDTATVTIAVNDPPVVALNPTNLVTNGSFETTTGWTSDVGGLETNTPSVYGAPAAPDGTRVGEVEGMIGARYIQQTISTVAGQQYSFSLQATTRANANVGDKGSLYVDGVKVLDFTTNAQFQTFMATFTATSASTVIRIQSEGSTSGTQSGATDGSGLVVDDVQVRAINNAVAYTENGAAVAITGTGDRLFDFDNSNLASATVTLTNPQTGDRLLVNGSAAASGTIGSISYTRTGTTVSFSGSATKADYEAAIRAVQFESTSDDPGTTNRIISVTVSDGTITSNTATTTITVIPVNDAPVNTLPASYTMAEDSGALALTGISVSDIDAGSGAITVTLSVPAGSGTLNATGAGGVSVTGSGTNAIVLSGTLANINAYLAGANRPTYTQVADFNGTITLTMVTNDGGNSGTGGALTDTDTSTITITPVADIVADTITIDEDTTGTAFVLLNDSFANAGARVTSINGVAVTPTTSIAATPPANFNGTYTINYTVTSGGVTENGTLTVIVRPVNDAPAGANATLTAVEDTPRAFAQADFGFTDTVEGDGFAGVVVTTLPANGTMLLNGATITAGTFVTAAQIAAGQLTWQAAPNANGSGLGSFTFQVRDTGGTANNGRDTDQSPNTITFTVTAVNDAPQGTNTVVNAVEDTPYTLSAGNFGFSDPTEGDGFAGVVISTLPANGTLRLNGVAVTAGQFVTAAQIAANQLVWTPAANANGNGLGAFTFQVRDTGGTANGGVDTDQSPNTLAFNVAAVNDAPSGTNNTLSATEDTPYTFTAANFGFSDAIDGNAFTGVVITTIPANGIMLLNGTAVTAGQFVTAAQLAAGQLTWQAAANANGAGLGSFTFQVRDDGGTSNGGVDTDQSPNTINFTVAAVNDAPAGTNATLTATEDTPYTFTAANFGFGDVDGSNFAGVVITTLPANGTMLLNGVAVTAGQFVTAAQIGAGQLTWQAAANANGANLGAFTFQVRDDGGAANGGVDTDQSPNTINFTVTAVSDAPQGTNAVLGATEDAPYVFAAGDFGFSDPSDGDAFAGVVITTVPANGTMLLNGVAVTAGQFVTAAQLSAGQLTWQSAANANGAGLGSFTFQVRDNGSPANGGVVTDATPNTISFAVAAVNDPPLIDLNGSTIATLPVSGGSFNLPQVESATDRTATGTVDLSNTVLSSVTAVISFSQIDNSFRIQINGVGLTTNAIELTSSDLGAGEVMLRFGDGGEANTPWVANANGLARIEVRITAAGVTFWGTRDTNSTVYEQMFLASGVATVPAFTAGTNSIDVINTVGNGPEQAIGTISVSGQTTNYAATYVENGAPVSIADAATYITDIDSANMTSATIALTNAQAGDQLTVNGSTAASGTVNGITYTRTATGVTLTGSFTKAQYADAIKLIGFSNTGDNPNGAVIRDVTVTVNDGQASSNTAHVAISVTPVNDPIVNAVRDYSVAEDSPLTLSGLSVSDPDAGTGTISVTLSVPSGAGTLTGASGGNVTVTGSGTNAITLSGTLADINAYLANAATQPVFRQAVADFNGTVALTMTSNDNGNTGTGGATTDTDVGTITIAPVADIAADTASVNEDGSVTISPLANDSFENGGRQITAINGTAIAVGGSVAVTGGTVTLNAGNQLVFTPAANFNGPANFSYTVTSGGVTETANVAVAVNAVNDRPTLSVPATVAATEDTSVALTGISFADVDAASGAVRVTITVPSGTLAWTAVAGVVASGSGTGTLVLTGSITAINNAIAASGLVYSPAANANGAVTLTTTINDQGNSGIDPGTSGDASSEEASATTTITIAAVNDAPVAASDSFATNENVPVTFNVLGNDSDVDSSTLTITRINGTAIAVGGSVAVTGGSVRLNADNTLTFTPNAGYSGSPSFTYTISDGALTSTATVFGQVGAINHAPAGTDATLTMLEDATYTFAPANFGYSDTLDNNAFTGVVITTLPANGTLRLNGAAVTAGQFVTAADIAAGRLTFTAAANANGTGLGAFTFQVRDDGGTVNGGIDTDQSPNTIRFNVTSVNDAPSGADAVLAATEDTPYVFAQANFGFTDPADGNAFAGVVITTLPVNGALTLNGVGVSAGQFVTAADIAAGRLVWTPAANANGAGLGSFTFQVRDTGGTANGGADTDASPNTISFSVAAVNDAPVAANDSFTTPEDNAATIDVRANDSDVDAGAVLTVTTVNGTSLVAGGPGVAVTGGVVTLDAQGRLLFTPTANFNGATSFTYTIRDDSGATASATVNGTVTPVADPVVNTVPASVTGAEDTTPIFSGGNGRQISVSDPDNGTLTVTLSAQQGVLTLSTIAGLAFTSGDGTADATMTFTGSTAAINAALEGLGFIPRADYNGAAQISMTTTRSQDGASDTDVIAITLTPVVDAVNDAVTTAEDTPATFNVLTGAGGAAADNFEDSGRTVTAVTQPPAGQGSVTFAANGTITYTPAANFNGTTSFTYTVTSGGVTETATVTVTVTPVNDAPTVDLNGGAAGTGYATSYTENGADVPIIAGNGVVADVDSAVLNGATVAIANGAAGDVLSISGGLPAGITATYDPTTYTLTLSGNATAAQYKAALDAVRFASTSENPSVTPRNVNVTVSDGALTSTPATATISVVRVNDAPQGADAVLSATEDTPYTLTTASFGFSDPAEGDAFAGVVITTLPANGSLTLNGVGVTAGQFVTAADIAANRLVWTPAANANGAGLGSFTFQVRDTGGTANGGADTDLSPNRISFNVANVNDAPVSSDLSVTIAEDSSITGTLPAYTDADGDTATYRPGMTTPANGSVTINANGSYTYTPNANFNGTDVFSFVVDDGRGGTTERSVTVTVTSVNDAPVLVSQVPDRTRPDGSVVSYDITPFFADPADGDPLTFSATGLPPGLVMTSGGLISGTLPRDASQGGPNGDGIYTVVITASDGKGGTVTDTLTFTVTNPAPTAVNDAATTAEDTPVTINVLNGSANGGTPDSDPDGDPLTVVSATAGNGTVTIGANGAITYTPNANFNGSDTIVYTISDGNGGTAQAIVSVTVTPVNDTPGASAIPDRIRSDGEAVSFNASAFFSDPDGNALSYSATGLPPGLTINPATGVISGTIAAGASGPTGNTTYTITVTANDGQGGQVSGTFRYFVANIAPNANDDTASVDEDGFVNIFALGNDSDPDGDGIQVVSVDNQALTLGGPAVNVANGQVQLVLEGGVRALRFTPTANYSGTASFTYTIGDGNSGTDTAVVTITVRAGNDTPTSQPIPDRVRADGQTFTYAIGTFFADGDGDTLNFAVTGLPAGLTIDPATGTISGTIDPGASQGGPNGDGIYTVTVTAYDGPNGTGLSTSRTFQLTTTNPGPNANNDTASTGEDTPVTVIVLANDTDPDGDQLTVTNAAAGHGTVTINGNGTLTYTPDADFNGTDTIVYTVVDGNGGTSSATVAVTVGAVNDAPVARPIPTIVTNDDAAVDFDVSRYFSDADSQDLDFTYTGTLPPGLSFDAETGRITGTLTNDASNGTPYTMTITADDGNGGSISTTLTWNIQNLPPSAFADSLFLSEDAGSTAGTNVLLNDVDPDNDGKVVAAVDGDPAKLGQPVTGSGGGTFVLNADGSYTFDPGDAFADLQVGETRTTTITYLLDDTDGGTDTGVITVTVDGRNDAPTAVTIPSYTAADSQSVTANPIDLSSYFSDVEGDALTFAATGLPAGLSMDTAGRITGTIAANASASGPYTVTVTADDGQGGTVSRSFTFNVTNPAPTAVNDTATTTEDTAIDVDVLGNDTDPDGDTLVVDPAFPPQAAHGTVSINPDGTLRYVPNANFTGTDTIVYRLSDGQGGLSSGSVSVMVTPVNDAPTGAAIPDIARNDGDSLSLNVSGYFGDLDGDTLTYTITGLPAGLSYDPATGLISGTIASGASGPTGRSDYPVQVVANDGNGGTTTVTFTLTAINIAPIATGDSATTQEDTAVDIAILANDSDPDGDGVAVIRVNNVTLTVGQSVAVADGTVTLINSGGTLKLRFTPNPDFNGNALFTYTIGDGNGGLDDAGVTVVVGAVNDTPAIVSPIPDRSRPDGATVNFAVAPFFRDADGDTLSYVVTGLPPGLTYDPASGTISGTIARNASQGGAGGVYTVTVTARDPSGATTAQSFDFATTNPPPVARRDTVSVAEDGSVTFNPITGAGTTNAANGSDSDPDNDPMAIVSVNDQPIAPGGSITLTEGVLSMNADGTLTFRPAANFTGIATVPYVVSDGNGGTAQAIISFTVTAVNDAPTIDLNGAAPGTGQAIAFTEGDAPTPIAAADAEAFDVEDQIVALDIALAGFVNAGQEVIHLSGTIELVAGTASSGTIAIGNATLRYTYDGATTLHFENATGATTPIARETASALIRALGYSNRSEAPTAGDRTLSFTATDLQGAVSAAAVATVSVSPVNDAPTSTLIPAQAGADAATISFDVSGYFSDVDSALTYSATNLPAGLTIDPATGVVSGTVDRSASLSGPYTVTITASDCVATTQRSFVWTIANPAPVAVNDTLTVGENGVGTGDVTPGTAGQDSDPDGDPLVVSAVNGVAASVGAVVAGSNGGTFSIDATGSYSFDPGGDFEDLATGQTRTTQVSYTISDGQGGTSTATVTVTVTGANDAPVAGPLANVAASDGQTLAIPTAAAFSDPDVGDTRSYTATGLPPGLSIDPATGEILGRLTAAASAGSPYSITVTMTDGGGQTVTSRFVLTASNVAPIARNDTATAAEDSPLSGTVASNDSDGAADGDTLRYTLVGAPSRGSLTLLPDGRYTYTPEANFSGTDSFTYQIDDGQGGTATATVVITVVAVNDAPVATGDSFTTLEDTPVTFDVRANDTDVDSPTLTITAIDGTAIVAGQSVAVIGGSVRLNADGTLTYTPNANYNGAPSFSYTVSDGSSSSTATVSGTVSAVNDAPGTNPSPIVTPEDTPAVGQIGLTDVDGDTLSYTLVNSPAHGTLILGSDGSYRYVPDADFNGSDSFQVLVSDGNGSSVLVTVPISVTAVNDAPIATAPPLTTAEDTAVTGRVTASDIEGDALTYAVATAPQHGTLTVNADGTYRYVPNPDFAGSDSFTIAVSDGKGGITNVTVPVSVTPVNDAPVAQASPLDAIENTPASGRIVATDVDGDTLTFAVATPPANGTLTVNPDGTYRYVPNADFVGGDSFQVRVSDGNGGTVLVTVPVTVRAGYTGTDVNALIGSGDPFAMAAFAGDGVDRTRFDGLAPSGQPGVSAPPIILSTVNGLRGLDGTPTFGAGPAVLRAVNGIRSLDGTQSFDGVEHPVEAVIRYLDRFTTLRSEVDLLFDNRGDPFHVRSFEGFSVRAISGGDHQLVLEAVVRGHVMYIELRDDGTRDQPPIVEFQLRMRDGRPLPDWVRFDRRGLAIVERPVDADQLRLIAVGIRTDGTRIELPVIVQGATGEVQRDAPIAKERGDRSDVAPLRTMAAKVQLADRSETERLLAAFGS